MRYKPFEDFFLIPLRNGLTKPKSVRGEGYKMVNMGELFAFPIIIDIEMDRVPLTEMEIQTCLLESGDLLFARQSLVREGAGQCSIFLSDTEKVCFESHLIRVRIDKSKANPLYYYYFFRSETGKKTIDSIVEQGAGASGIRGSDLSKLRVPDLEKTQQDKIVSILYPLDRKIYLNRKTNETLEQIAQALFKSWFVDFEPVKAKAEGQQPTGIDEATAALFPDSFENSELGMIPKGWKVSTIDSVCDFQNGYAFKSNEMSKDATNAYKVFKMGNIRKGGGFNREGTKDYFDKVKAKNLSRYLIKKGDILMCMTDMKNNVALLGHTALMNVDNEYLINQRVGLLRPKNKRKANYPFLYILTNSDFFIRNLRSRANSGVQVNLSTKEIKDTKFILPSEEIHLAFNKVAETIQEKIFSLEIEQDFLLEIRDTLFPKLLSGEITMGEMENTVEDSV